MTDADGVSPTLTGRYHIERLLASGGMGTVYVAVDTTLQRRVVVKVIRDHHVGDDGVSERFRREATSAAQLSHTHIARAFDFGVDDEGRPFLVMEFVDGRDLACVLRDGGPMPPGQAAAVMAKVCRGLAHAHAHGIVHRDVKPSNILLGAEGDVKITDFGIARALDHATLTGTGQFLGSAGYVAPEQVTGGPVGPAADVYAAGVVLYELLVGEPPFGRDEAPATIAVRRLHADVPPPSARNPGVPAWLDAVVSHATRRRPGDRFAEAAAMAAALEARTDPAGATTVRLPLQGDERDEPAPAPLRSADARTAVLSLMPVLVLGFLLGFAAVLLARGGATEPPAPPVAADAAEASTLAPGVVGLQGEAVADLLRDQGYEVEVLARPSRAAQGTVVVTDPAPGEPLTPGQTIVLTTAE